MSYLHMEPLQLTSLLPLRYVQLRNLILQKNQSLVRPASKSGPATVGSTLRLAYLRERVLWAISDPCAGRKEQCARSLETSQGHKKTNDCIRCGEVYLCSPLRLMSWIVIAANWRGSVLQKTSIRLYCPGQLDPSSGVPGYFKETLY